MISRLSDLPRFSDLIASWFGSSLPLQFRGYGASEIGTRSAANADVFRIHDELSLYVVADGFGPNRLGIDASLAGVNGFVNKFAALNSVINSTDHGHAIHDDSLSERQIRSLLVQSFIAAAIDVNQLRETNHPDQSFGASLTALMCVGQHAYFASLGHCRGYRWRDGRLQQITVDDTLGAELDRTEGVHRTGSAYTKLLTRHLGDRKTFEPHVSVASVRPDDWLLLLSDGVYKTLEISRVNEIIVSSHPTSLPKAITQSACNIDRHDDCAALAVRVGSPADIPATTVGQKSSSRHSTKAGLQVLHA